jgi:predicted dehydrogenase
MSSNSRSSNESGRRITRREMLRRAAAVAVPVIIPSHVFGNADVPAANERIHIGVVGIGIRGKHLIGDMPAGGRVVAVCDCFLPNAREALKPAAAAASDQTPSAFLEHDAANCEVYADYRKLFDEAKLDAVVISAPDHHHVHASMLACQAGLDVYCEKPLSLTIAEGRRLVQAVRRYQRVLQVGSQQRSMEMDRFACQFVRDGGLGKVSRVEVQNWPGPIPDESLPEQPIPDGMHWDLFCGPRPLRPYHWRRWLKDRREWQGKPWRGWDMWRDYSGHLMTNWGAHAVDIVQWALGMDQTGPVQIEPLVQQHAGPRRECPVVLRYPQGTELQMTSPKGFYAGGYFHGERGDIKIVRNGFTPIPRSLLPEQPDPKTRELWLGKGIVARPHLQNWLDCIKSRSEPVAPVEVGHRSVTICHLAGIARELGRTLRWDPESETFPDDEQARGLLDRERRSGWELPDVA